MKDVRSAPLDLEKEKLPLDSQQISLVNFPTVLGKGIHNGYLQKASVKDINVWRKRWFVVKVISSESDCSYILKCCVFRMINSCTANLKRIIEMSLQ
jgi:hypothetical protein